MALRDRNGTPQELHRITSHHVGIRRSVITNNVQDSSNSSTTEGRGVVVRVKSHLHHLMYYSAVLYSLWTAEIVASYYLLDWQTATSTIFRMNAAVPESAQRESQSVDGERPLAGARKFCVAGVSPADNFPCGCAV
jgi:hypothetical protein